MKKEKKISQTSVLSLLSGLFIFSIFLIQAYVVYNYYTLTKDHLQKETNTILDEAFRAELSIRYYDLGYSNITVTDPEHTINKTDKVSEYDLDKIGVDPYNNNIQSAINMAMNELVSKIKPISLHRIDSIMQPLLHEKNIRSSCYIQIMDTHSGAILEHLGNLPETSIFEIKSKELYLDLKNTRYLQVILQNPNADIFRRMGLLLFCTLLFSLFAIYSLWRLQSILAKQKVLIQTKNDFFDQVAHELRRPVSRMKLAIEKLSVPAVTQDPKRERYISIANASTSEMANKIDMVLTLSKAEETSLTLNYTRFDLVALGENLKEQYLQFPPKELSITLTADRPEIWVNADETHIRQSISNLMDNAIKYSRSSVSIQIEINQLDKEVSFSVKDNGVGMPADKLSSIFEKYTRLSEDQHSKGFGIGLSYIKEIVERHRGRIIVESQLHEGSTFIVYLPF